MYPQELKTVQANLIKFQRKVSQSKKLCHEQSMPPGNFYALEGTSGGILKSHHLSVQPYKLCVSRFSKTVIGNLMKPRRKVKQIKKVCQKLGSHHQGQGDSRRSKVCHLQILCQP